MIELLGEEADRRLQQSGAEVARELNDLQITDETPPP